MILIWNLRASVLLWLVVAVQAYSGTVDNWSVPPAGGEVYDSHRLKDIPVASLAASVGWFGRM